MDRPSTPLWLRVRAWLPFILSAAAVAALLSEARQHPWLLAAVPVLLLVLWIPRFRARRDMRRLVESGNVDALVHAWQDAVEDLPHSRTMLPLIQATAFAANGLTERARSALERAERGDAWEAAIEHRLIVETLLDTFEGQRTQALEKAAELSRLPMPPVGPWMQARVSQARDAISALARVFARVGERSDFRVLRDAARNHPLIHWPLRYAAAVAAIDDGRPKAARELIRNAPDWPEDSAFRQFHDEISAQATAEPR